MAKRLDYRRTWRHQLCSAGLSQARATEFSRSSVLVFENRGLTRELFPRSKERGLIEASDGLSFTPHNSGISALERARPH